ncbi:hypothetical protein MJO28_012470 [Puccinia striiformis f. sp. tritici]|uniref:Large ribosomal subunit protein mL54 n=2 Tax=Puccinia striiformis f. sp. tritici TaxID=168172 RepID=A0A0L0VQN3_9BASI|nr:hypothetical protein Pst134EA_022630 [Puccinia striiformis f. sp. tritici]KAI9605792.1 hypothetical protein H4Q26_004160 [Puccinia striiformis f. sp. tritici PST-130]KNF01502.1 hypothetical protein PSTG_05282 [Puccinia striiformis f. sp. tritici PST-78]KAH9445676.1 hypothetical protein Pst134EB_023512 [Puccinia striiformis f. sp. tritici]KAH9455152.1 hypothetical protein Pst134EA_022630 [Puccinia striiformis f. sp. tritici]KAI7942443.1 hypothetical protein MJO28_012470 [Puccinia striiformis
MSSLVKTGLRLSRHSGSNPLHSRTAPSTWVRHLAHATPQEKKTTQAKKTGLVSTIPEGSPIKGLAYIKGESDPIAKADGEYPSWLWTLLEPNMGAGHSDTPLRAVRRELNRENRINIRKSNFLKSKK